MKIRFLEPGNRPYKPTPLNYFVYDRYIRTPSVGLNTLATIVKELVDDTYMYSESISRIDMDDVEDADIVFIGIFTFAAVRGYELADHLRAHGRGLVVLGGLHASMNCAEAARHCDYVLLGEGDETIRAFVEAVGRGERPDFPGLAWMEGEELRSTGYPPPPERFETIADRNLVHNYSKMVGHSTLWPQVHASRGCPHNCDYCALVRHFGRRVRTRSPENVVADIRESIRFFHRGHVRLAKDLWLTDDNFFADRDWAMSVLRAIVDSGIRYRFNVQARYEVGFDDEMLDLLRQAGFFELDLGIEFLDDASFATYHKKSTRQEIIDAIRNIRAHGLSVRGLFILGSDDQEAGVGDQLADFVIQNHIQGTLIQCMYFVPGTPVYEANRDRLLHQDWSKYNGNAVHFPRRMTPYQLQLEHIRASRKIYSWRRLFSALVREKLPPLKNNPAVFGPQIYMDEEDRALGEEDAFLEMGKELGCTAKAAKRAYRTAKKAELAHHKARVQKQEQLCRREGMKILIAAHSYVAEDPYMGRTVVDYLKKAGIIPLRADLTDRDAALKRSRELSPTCKWEISREILGGIALRRDAVDGIILLSAFPCGPDAMVNELIARRVKDVPLLNLVLDSQSGAAGVETRLESFIDIIRFKEGKL